MSINEELDDIEINKRMELIAKELNSLKINLEEREFTEEEAFTLTRDYAIERFIVEANI